MWQEYGSADEIPDEAIKKAFASADLVILSARRINRISSLLISFGVFGWWLPLTRVLPLINITPQMLRPVFNPQRKLVKRQNSNGVGLEQWGFDEVELPKHIESYEQLGEFLLTDKPSQELARIFGKTVEIREEDGRKDLLRRFTVHPFGEIAKAAER